jgi:NADH:ubiquinone oxidoreductase subunit 6 (subunit J)
VIVAVVIVQLWPLTPGTDSLFGARPPVDPELLRGSVAALGRAFVSADAYVIPFELASVLLLAALVGAIVVAWPKEEDRP